MVLMTARANSTFNVSRTGDYYGLGGNDQFVVNQQTLSLSDFYPMLSGGEGNDNYSIGTLKSGLKNAIVSIHENGFSTSDTLSFEQNFFANSSPVIVEFGSHLFIGAGSGLGTGQGVLLLDWLEQGHEIETFNVAGQVYSHAQFVSKVRGAAQHKYESGSVQLDSARNQADRTEDAKYISEIESEYATATDAIYRFYNQATGAHFYTASALERNNVLQSSEQFVFEGVSFGFASQGGDVDVYRFYNASSGAHFYTAGETERDYVISNLPSFVYEGVAYKAYSTESESTTALYRFYNTNSNTHFYTADAGEKAWVEQTFTHLIYEGIAYYVSDLS